MPDNVRYETFDIEKVNAKGYNIRTTPTMMVFVDGKLEDTSSGLLRGDRLRVFLDRWGFTDNETQPDDADLTDDDFNPGEIRDAGIVAQSATASTTQMTAVSGGAIGNEAFVFPRLGKCSSAVAVAFVTQAETVRHAVWLLSARALGDQRIGRPTLRSNVPSLCSAGLQVLAACPV